MSKERLIKNGERLDGRGLHELRELSIEPDVLKRADGSARLEWGGNKIIAGIYGPREVHPSHLQKSDRTILRPRYNMAPFSVGERKSPGPDRRSTEISMVSRWALEPAVMVQQFPRTGIDISIEILEAAAGTRVAGITATSVALADAGIPMRDLVTACAVGKVNGELVIDLSEREDKEGEADIPIAMLPRNNEISLLQMDGEVNKEELEELMKLGTDAIKKIYEIQKEALRDKYEKVGEDNG